MAEDELSTADVQPDTSNFVEHLRLVHFTLLAACVITLIAVTSQEPSSASRAYDQTNDLIKAGSRWHLGLWAPAFINQKRSGILQSKGGAYQEEVAIDVLNPPSDTDAARFSFANTWYVANLSNSGRLTDIGPARSGKSIGFDFRIADNDDNPKRERVPDFNILDGAIKIWDRLHRFQYVVFVKKLGTGWLVWRNQGGASPTVVNLAASDKLANAAQKQGTKITASFPGLLLRQDLVELLKRGPWLYGEGRLMVLGQTSDPAVDDYNTLAKLVDNDKDTQCYFFDAAQRLVLRADCVVDYLPLQLSLVDGLIPTTPLGDFPRSFSDVDELAKHLRSLPLTDLQTFFRAEKNRTGDKIEFPGIKVPGEAVTIWGTIILVVLLGYFVIVLRELSARIVSGDKGWNVPWIGISADKHSRAAYLGSMLFVLGTIGYLTLGTSSGYARAAYGSGFVVALALTWLGVLSWWRLLARETKSANGHATAAQPPTT